MPNHSRNPLQYPLEFRRMVEEGYKGEYVYPPLPNKGVVDALRMRFYGYRRALAAQVQKDESFGVTKSTWKSLCEEAQAVTASIKELEDGRWEIKFKRNSVSMLPAEFYLGAKTTVIPITAEEEARIRGDGENPAFFEKQAKIAQERLAALLAQPTPRAEENAYDLVPKERRPTLEEIKAEMGLSGVTKNPQDPVDSAERPAHDGDVA